VKTLFLVSWLASCQHQRNDLCVEGDAYCGPRGDDKSALICLDGKLVRLDCGGPTGCSRNGRNSVVCDQARSTFTALK
jgi:hypothetical protein